MIGLPLVVMVFVVVVVEVVVFVEVVVGGVIVIVIGVSCSRSFLLSLYESVVQVTVALSVGVLVAAVFSLFHMQKCFLLCDFPRMATVTRMAIMVICIV